MEYGRIIMTEFCDSNEVKLVVKTNRKSVNIPKISFNVSGE